MTTLSLAAYAESCADDVSHELSLASIWRQLPSLPDPVGFGGMFAGSMNGVLVVGGGSQFRDKPVWLGGTKSFSDRVFTLSTPKGAWREDSFKLPVAAGHFASAVSGEAIYIIGGIAESGCLASAYALKNNEMGLFVQPLPDLPRPLGYAAAAVLQGRLWVAGGQYATTDKSGSAEAWSLNLSDYAGGWRREGDLPGPGVIVACSAVDEDGFYIFSGMAFDADGKAIPSKRAYKYEVSGRRWVCLPDLPAARVGAATPCPRLTDGRFILIGGYGQVFDGPPREYPGFEAQTFLYDAILQSWVSGPVMPREAYGDRDIPTDKGPMPMVAAPCVEWKGLAVVVAGETRPATRTASVMALNLRQD